MNDSPDNYLPLQDESYKKQADQLINRYVFIAVGCGLIPAPFVDAVSVAGLELIMISDLAKIYESPFPTKLAVLKAFISLVGSIGPIYVVTHARPPIKILPVVGYISAATTYSIVNGVSVFAVGKVFQYHFESGGNLISFDNEILRKIFVDEYERGKKIVPQLIARIKKQDVIVAEHNPVDQVYECK